MTISPLDGELSPSTETNQSTPITITYTPQGVSITSLYLLIRNVSNPTDIKTIHLTLETIPSRSRDVSDDKVPLKLFDVKVSGGLVHNDNVLRLGTVHFGTDYREKSIVIRNISTQRLQFTVCILILILVYIDICFINVTFLGDV